MFHSLFNSQARLRNLSCFLLSFNFTLWSTGTAKPTIRQVLSFFFFFVFFFFVDYYLVWLSGRDLVIPLYLIISEKCVRLILQDTFWIVHIPFARMVKFQFLVQFQVDHLAHPDESNTVSILVCSNRLLFYWSFRLHHHITYICSYAVLSILALIILVLIVLFWGASRRDSFSP